MNYYIVRIYRRDPDNNQKMSGIVEEACDGKKQKFSTFDELWKILRTAKHERGRREVKTPERRNRNSW
jgi:hypothetical protein